MMIYFRHGRMGHVASAEPVVSPFMTVEKRFEIDKYVRVILLLPYISNVCDGMNHALDKLEPTA